jgi:hippurate hydrolase
MRASLRQFGLVAGTLLAMAGPLSSQAASLGKGLDALYPLLESTYQDLHRNPELSNHEARTAAKMGDLLRKAGYEVASVGGGVVGVLRNGQGPTVLLRTELDALPVEERTGLPYASAVKGVMHACGHDSHMAIWLGAASLLAQRRELWHGTVLMVGQPAEETVEGARAMIKDGLFTRFPKPDFALALHGAVDLPAGKVSWVPGYAMAAVDSVDLTLYGRGGHGAKPETTVDPIVLAAKTVLAIQTAVSREKDPQEPAVVTVGSIHGGFKHNIIPDEVKLQMTVRSFNPAVQAKLLKAIARIAKGEALASGAPREPLVYTDEGQAATWNDPVLAERLAGRLAKELGAECVLRGRPDMVSEDFGEFGKAAGIPSVLLRLGTVEPARFKAAEEAGTQLPSLHSSGFAPAVEPTLRTGALVLTLSALEVLGKKE